MAALHLPSAARICLCSSSIIIMTITLMVIGALLGTCSLSFLVGLLTERPESAAARTYRNIELRNGTTAPSPWHARTAPINAPGLVEVHPRSHTPAPMPAPPPSLTIQPALPAPVSVAEAPEQAAATASEAPKLPIDFAEAANETEATVIVEMWEQGLSMTKTIKQVWNISAGGGKKYKSARARYQHYISEVAS